MICGHSNVGKSSLCGRLLVDLNMIDQRELVKIKAKAIDKNRESWWLAFLLDSDDKE